MSTWMIVWITTLARHSNKGRSTGPGRHGTLHKGLLNVLQKKNKTSTKLYVVPCEELMLRVKETTATRFRVVSCFERRTQKWTYQYCERFLHWVSVDTSVQIFEWVPTILEQTMESLHQVVFETTRRRQRSQNQAKWFRVNPQSHFVTMWKVLPSLCFSRCVST